VRAHEQENKCMCRRVCVSARAGEHMYVQESACVRMSRRVHECAGECACAHEQESTSMCRRVYARTSRRAQVCAGECVRA